MNYWKIKGLIKSCATKEQIIDDLGELGFVHFSVELETKEAKEISDFDRRMGRE